VCRQYLRTRGEPDRRRLEPAIAVLGLEFDRQTRADIGLGYQQVVHMQKDILAALIGRNEPITP